MKRSKREPPSFVMAWKFLASIPSFCCLNRILNSAVKVTIAPIDLQTDVSLLTPPRVATNTINPLSRRIEKAFPNHSVHGDVAEKPGACSFHSEGRSVDLLTKLFNRSVPGLAPVEGIRPTQPWTNLPAPGVIPSFARNSPSGQMLFRYPLMWAPRAGTWLKSFPTGMLNFDDYWPPRCFDRVARISISTTLI